MTGQVLPTVLDLFISICCLHRCQVCENRFFGVNAFCLCFLFLFFHNHFHCSIHVLHYSVISTSVTYKEKIYFLCSFPSVTVNITSWNAENIHDSTYSEDELKVCVSNGAFTIWTFVYFWNRTVFTNRDCSFILIFLFSLQVRSNWLTDRLASRRRDSEPYYTVVREWVLIFVYFINPRTFAGFATQPAIPIQKELLVRKDWPLGRTEETINTQLIITDL